MINSFYIKKKAVTLLMLAQVIMHRCNMCIYHFVITTIITNVY